MPQVIGPIVIMSICSTIFVAGIGRLFVGKFEISPFTIPFIMCVWIWQLGASNQFLYWPLNGAILSPHLARNPLIYQEPDRLSYDGVECIKAVFRGVSQVYF